MRRTPIGMINTVLRTEYYSTLPWITPVLCLDYTSTLPRVLRYSRLSTGVLSREYCHKDRVSVSHKDRHLWIASHRGWYLLFHPDVFHGANHEAGGTAGCTRDGCYSRTINIKGILLVFANRWTRWTYSTTL